MPLFALYTHRQNIMLKLSQAFNKMYSVHWISASAHIEHLRGKKSFGAIYKRAAHLTEVLQI